MENIFTELYKFFPTIILFDYLSIIISIGFLLPSISVTVRRIHDVNKSGWWLLWLNMAPSVTLIWIDLTIDATEFFNNVIFVTFLVLSIISIIVSLFWMFSKGTDGNNKFGSNPLKNND